MMKGSLAVGLMLVVGLAAASSAQMLSGSWNTTVSITPSPAALTIDSRFLVTYTLSGWSLSSDTVVDENGWVDQNFVASGTLGTVAIGSLIDFAPSTPSAFFTKWTTAASLSVGGVSFVGIFTLTSGNTQLVISASGSLGDVTMSSSSHARRPHVRRGLRS